MLLLNGVVMKTVLRIRVKKRVAEFVFFFAT